VKVIRYAKISIRGTISYKSEQISAYADDIDIAGRSQPAVKEAFISFEKTAREMHLQIIKLQQNARQLQKMITGTAFTNTTPCIQGYFYIFVCI
jgi:hypothetical protein